VLQEKRGELVREMSGVFGIRSCNLGDEGDEFTEVDSMLMGVEDKYLESGLKVRPLLKKLFLIAVWVPLY
jgi:hypothetical protein